MANMTVQETMTAIFTITSDLGWQPIEDEDTVFHFFNPLFNGTMTVKQENDAFVELIHSRPLWRGSVREISQVIDAQFEEDEVSHHVRVMHRRAENGDYEAGLLQTMSIDSRAMLEAAIPLMGDRMKLVSERYVDAIVERIEANGLDHESSGERGHLLRAAYAIKAMNSVVRHGNGRSSDSGTVRITAVSDAIVTARDQLTRLPVQIFMRNGDLVITFILGMGGQRSTNLDDIEARAREVVGDGPGTVLRLPPGMGDRVMLMAGVDPELKREQIQAVVKHLADFALRVYDPEFGDKLDGLKRMVESKRKG